MQLATLLLLARFESGVELAQVAAVSEALALSVRCWFARVLPSTATCVATLPNQALQVQVVLVWRPVPVLLKLVLPVLPLLEASLLLLLLVRSVPLPVLLFTVLVPVMLFSLVVFPLIPRERLPKRPSRQQARLILRWSVSSLQV